MAHAILFHKISNYIMDHCYNRGWMYVLACLPCVQRRKVGARKRGARDQVKMYHWRESVFRPWKLREVKIELLIWSASMLRNFVRG